MNIVLGFGSSADCYHFECAPEQDVPAEASPGVLGESTEVLHLVGRGGGGELVRRDGRPLEGDS